jgi:hypothetical protein
MPKFIPCLFFASKSAVEDDSYRKLIASSQASLHRVGQSAKHLAELLLFV